MCYGRRTSCAAAFVLSRDFLSFQSLSSISREPIAGASGSTQWLDRVKLKRAAKASIISISGNSFQSLVLTRSRASSASAGVPFNLSRSLSLLLPGLRGESGPPGAMARLLFNGLLEGSEVRRLLRPKKQNNSLSLSSLSLSPIRWPLNPQQAQQFDPVIVRIYRAAGGEHHQHQLEFFSISLSNLLDLNPQQAQQFDPVTERIQSAAAGEHHQHQLDFFSSRFALIFLCITLRTSMTMVTIFTYEYDYLCHGSGLRTFAPLAPTVTTRLRGLHLLENGLALLATKAHARTSRSEVWASQFQD